LEFHFEERTSATAHRCLPIKATLHAAFRIPDIHADINAFVAFVQQYSW
jgi:hypothetical protein